MSTSEEPIPQIIPRFPLNATACALYITHMLSVVNTKQECQWQAGWAPPGGLGHLHYYRNRYYMPGNGIFTSRDAMWADVHRGWGYVGNNPVNLIDPYGLLERGGRTGIAPVDYFLDELYDVAEAIDAWCGEMWDHLRFGATLAVLSPAFLTWPVREGADYIAEDLGLRDWIAEKGFGLGGAVTGNHRLDMLARGAGIAFGLAGLVIDWRDNIPSAEELRDTIEYQKKRIYGDD